MPRQARGPGHERTRPGQALCAPRAPPASGPFESTVPFRQGGVSACPDRTARARTTPTGSLRQAVHQAVHQVVLLVNGERAAHGCPAVRWNAALQRAAQGHADDMAARRFFGHTHPDGVDPGARITAAGYSWSGRVRREHRGGPAGRPRPPS
nr:CAP domain-containing protein [Streptomyces sp. 9-7]